MKIQNNDKNKHMRHATSAGFSLVELIVVIAIMAILVGVAAPSIMKQIEKSRGSKCLYEMDNLDRAYEVELYTYTETNHNDLLKTVFTRAGLTAEPQQGVFTGNCPSGGTYTLTLDKETGAIMTFTCSKHSDNALEPTPLNYMTYIKNGFESWLADLSPEDRAKYIYNDKITQFDSGAIISADSKTSKMMESLNASLASVGLKQTDTSLWRVLYNSKTNEVKVYYVDTGSELKAGQKVQGQWIQMDLDGGEMTITEKADCSIAVNDKDHGSDGYLYINNAGDFKWE